MHNFWQFTAGTTNKIIQMVCVYRTELFPNCCISFKDKCVSLQSDIVQLSSAATPAPRKAQALRWLNAATERKKLFGIDETPRAYIWLVYIY